jgi:putative transposase
LLIENGEALARVIDYIHLNPVRAKVVSAENVASFTKSSLHAFVSGPRSRWLFAGDLLKQNGLNDTADGWAEYVASLAMLAGNSMEQERRGFSKFNRGWAIGTRGWREALAKDHAHLALDSKPSEGGTA